MLQRLRQDLPLPRGLQRSIEREGNDPGVKKRERCAMVCNSTARMTKRETRRHKKFHNRERRLPANPSRRHSVTRAVDNILGYMKGH